MPLPKLQACKVAEPGHHPVDPTPSGTTSPPRRMARQAPVTTTVKTGSHEPEFRPRLSATFVCRRLPSTTPASLSSTCAWIVQRKRVPPVSNRATCVRSTYAPPARRRRRRPCSHRACVAEHPPAPTTRSFSSTLGVWAVVVVPTAPVCATGGPCCDRPGFSCSRPGLPYMRHTHNTDARHSCDGWYIFKARLFH